MDNSSAIGPGLGRSGSVRRSGNAAELGAERTFERICRGEYKHRMQTIDYTLFNTTVTELISLIERKSRDELELGNLDMLKRRIRLFKQTMGDEIMLVEAAPFFVQYAPHILKPDIAEREKFFLEMDVRAEFLVVMKQRFPEREAKIAPEDEFAFALNDSVRVHYKKSSVVEREKIYEKVKVLLGQCIRHQMNLRIAEESTK